MSKNQQIVIVMTLVLSFLLFVTMVFVSPPVRLFLYAICVTCVIALAFDLGQMGL